jgi:hypothetical protein
MQSNAGNQLRNISSLRDCTTGVLFLGTPHHGGNRGIPGITTKIMNANGIHTSLSTMKLLTKQLKKIDLDEQHQLFGNMVENQHKKGLEMQIHTFLQKEKMPLFTLWRTSNHVCFPVQNGCILFFDYCLDCSCKRGKL